jgi:hypothetical protein
MMSTTHTPELVAALNDFADWLFHHDDLPTFCNADFEDAFATRRWALKLQLNARGDEQVFTDLSRFATVLGTEVTLDEPFTTKDGNTFVGARVTAPISERLRVTVWGHLYGPDALAKAA